MVQEREREVTEREVREREREVRVKNEENQRLQLLVHDKDQTIHQQQQTQKLPFLCPSTTARSPGED